MRPTLRDEEAQDLCAGVSPPTLPCIRHLNRQVSSGLGYGIPMTHTLVPGSASTMERGRVEQRNP